MQLTQSNVDRIITILISATEKILSVYSSKDFNVRIKEDKSPLTEADILSHNIVVEGLSKIFGKIPILSEESKEIPFAERKRWDYFWLVDPLDGTKEFIQKNNEFTINIALIKGNKPVSGFIMAPVSGEIYFGLKNKGAFLRSKDEKIIPISARSQITDKIFITRSRSHSGDKEEKVLKSLGDTEDLHVGSSLKFCYLAKGKADIYFRSGPTMEWDTAAGQALAEAAGAKMVDLEAKDFLYNKESLRNPGFLCSANSELIDKIINLLQD